MCPDPLFLMRSMSSRDIPCLRLSGSLYHSLLAATPCVDKWCTHSPLWLTHCSQEKQTFLTDWPYRMTGAGDVDNQWSQTAPTGMAGEHSSNTLADNRGSGTSSSVSRWDPDFVRATPVNGLCVDALQEVSGLCELRLMGSCDQVWSGTVRGWLVEICRCITPN